MVWLKSQSTTTGYSPTFGTYSLLFERGPRVSQYNAQIIKYFEGNIGIETVAQPGTPVTYGS